MHNTPISVVPKASVSKKKANTLGAKNRKMKVRRSVRKKKKDTQPLFKPPQEGVPNKVTIAIAHKAAAKAWKKLSGQGNAVTFQNVVKETLLALKCPSVKSLGFCISDVPCLQTLAHLEGKVNTIISGHLAARNVTTLYDLSQDILSTEGIKKLFKFRMGPLSLHPLVIEHFNLPKGFTICRITAMDVMNRLSEYLGKHADNVASSIELKDFLSYIMKKRNLPSTDRLCVRIQDFGSLVRQMRWEREAGARSACYKVAQAPCKSIAAAKIQKVGTTESLMTRPHKKSSEELLADDLSEFQEFSKTKVEDISISSSMQEDTQFVNLPSREQICANYLDAAQQVAMGNRLGEAVVFNHLVERFGSKHVTWMNEEMESGLPYDIVVDELDEQSLILVKVAWLEQDDWFEVSNAEWKLATNDDKNLIIIRVFLGGISGFARLVWLPNPSKLCQEGTMKLALRVPLRQPVGING